MLELKEEEEQEGGSEEVARLQFRAQEKQTRLQALELQVQEVRGRLQEVQERQEIAQEARVYSRLGRAFLRSRRQEVVQEKEVVARLHELEQHQEGVRSRLRASERELGEVEGRLEGEGLGVVVTRLLERKPCLARRAR